jgi:uncharacterized protein YxjI
LDAPDQHSNDGITGAASDAGFTRYRLPQNVAAIPGAIVIKSDRGVAAFEIDGGVQATDDVIRVRDLTGVGACLIRGGTMRAGDAIEIVDQDAARLATIARVELSPVRDQFSVRVGSETAWTVEGLVADYEYWIRERRDDIAQVSRRWFRARDSYGVQVAAGHDDLLVLTVAVCLDLFMHAGR